MRKLVILRGPVGSGKSTFVEQYKLKRFALSEDQIRNHYTSPILTFENEYTANREYDGDVWHHLMSVLQRRMSRGEFTVVDAMHIETTKLECYLPLCQKYNYKPYLVDFSNIPIDTLMRRNNNRPLAEQVPHSVLYESIIKIQKNTVPDSYLILNPSEFKKTVIQPKKSTLTNYKEIHHIGDVHGCYSVLKSYWDTHYSEQNFYIFTGDYFDRGSENGEVYEFIQSVAKKENVVLIEGNHERHVWNWAWDTRQEGKLFREFTLPQLSEKGVTRKEAKTFLSMLTDHVYYTYQEKTVLVTHGGLHLVPRELTLVPSQTFISGIGMYEDDIDQAFSDWALMAEPDTYQVHGHRNMLHREILATANSFNVDGSVERGGSLRVAILSESGWSGLSFKNTYPKQFKKKQGRYDVLKEVTYPVRIRETNEVANTIDELRLILHRGAHNEQVHTHYHLIEENGKTHTFLTSFATTRAILDGGTSYTVRNLPSLHAKKVYESYIKNQSS